MLVLVCALVELVNNLLISAKHTAEVDRYTISLAGI